jgi:hypothetical protein
MDAREHEEREESRRDEAADDDGRERTLDLRAGPGGATRCSKPTERFESSVQVVRHEAVKKDKDGTTLIVDFEVEWDACPGDRFQVLRGDKDFAACTAGYEIGQYVPTMVRHYWDDRGFYRWDIERLGDCPRAIDPNALGSYEKSEDCDDVKAYGLKVGFRCDRKASPALLKRCPWMARE